MPIWPHLSNILLIAWSPIGINWMAGRIGRMMCLDVSTESMERLYYAKCLVEASPLSDMVISFTVSLEDGSEQHVQVYYQWKPEARSICKVFEHTIENCLGENVEEVEDAAKKEGEVVTVKKDVGVGSKVVQRNCQI